MKSYLRLLIPLSGLSLLARVSCFIPSRPSLQQRILYTNHGRSVVVASMSLQNLLKKDSTKSSSSTFTGLSKAKSPQFVFVGGKGGVGKTTTSSAIAVAFSDRSLNTLVVSTDPAHSLGDALDHRLPPGQIMAVPSETALWALEIDIEQELQAFRRLFDQFDEQALAADLGIPASLIETLGLKDLSEIVKNAPAGIDEILALSKLFQYADLDLNNNADNNIQSFFGMKQSRSRFDRIVIDTAPTGHTLRLLQLPQFVSSFTTSLLKVRGQLDSLMSTFGAFLGGSKEGSNGNKNKLSSLLDQVQTLQANMKRLGSVLTDPQQTQFVVVTIPTQLALQESKRLIDSLDKSKVAVSTIVVNQVLQPAADPKYLTTIAKGQRRVLAELKQHVQGLKLPVEVTEVNYVNVEMVGYFGLKMFANLAHPPAAKTAANPLQSRRLTIFGGKGGVGKTSSAASWAVSLAESGFRTLVVSSDPAHSLGDALQSKLTGEPKMIEQTLEGGELWAMEIDPTQAMDDFRQTLLGDNSNSNKEATGGGLGLSEMVSDLLLSSENPPPGTDEIVAITKVMRFLDRPFTTPSGKQVKFDRIVLDTAPTGHTLRMLSLPPTMRTVIQKARNLRDKVGSLDVMFGGAPPSSSPSSPANEQGDRLLQFERDMQRLEEVLHSDKDCEFAVVTIATEVAAAETKRLLQALQQERILVRRLIVNQLMPAAVNDTGEVSLTMSSAENYLRDVRKGQTAVVNELEALSQRLKVPLVQVPYCASEVRTVYGVRYISSFLFPPEGQQ